MPAERYVVLGLAQVRSRWFRDVARWSTTGAVPVEFVKAISVEEVRVRLRAGRGYSALLIDQGVIGLDRDLVDLAREAGCAVIPVAGSQPGRSWNDLGASAVLPAEFGRTELMQVLGQVATAIARTSEATLGRDPAHEPPGFRGALVAVTGSGGTGASTVAIAVAQALATDARFADLVCLADLARHGEQAALHGARDVVPGVVELVDAHRTGTPGIDAVRDLTWAVRERGYHLLLGLRRQRDWTAVRPRAFDAALDGLRRSFRAVVADVDADLEGEAESGSLDVEDRNAMARSTVRDADLVVVVGHPGMKGLHSLLRVTRDVLAHGVAGRRVLPVVNRAPRGPRARAEITSAFGELLAASAPDHGVPGPLHLPERRGIDDAVRDGARLPDAWSGGVSGAVLALLDQVDLRSTSVTHDEPQLVPVQPGSLGSWAEPDDAAHL